MKEKTNALEASLVPWSSETRVVKLEPDSPLLNEPLGYIRKIKFYDGKPGAYLCNCLFCKCEFRGDKRDICCPDCEIPDLKAIALALERRLDIEHARRVMREGQGYTRSEDGLINAAVLDQAKKALK
jgi:hypothetical protein